MGRGGKETSQRFPLTAAKRKQNPCFLALSFPVLRIFAQLYNPNVTFLMLEMLLICVAIVPNLTFLIYQLTYFLLTILLKLFQFISVPYFALRRADECIHYTLLDRLSGFYCFHWLCFQ